MVREVGVGICYLVYPFPSIILRLTANLRSAPLIRCHNKANQLNALTHFDNTFIDFFVPYKYI